MRAITTSVLEDAGTAIRTKFSEAMADIDNAVPIYWPGIAEPAPSNDLKEVYGRIAGLPAYRKWIGPREINRMEAGDYTIHNEKHELTVSLQGDDLRFDKIGLRSFMATQQGARARQLPDTLVWPRVNAGFTTNGPDGVPFFSTTHPLLLANGQWSNTGSNYTAGDSAPWYLTGGLPGMKPLILQEVVKPNLVEKFDPRDDRVFMNDEFVWGSWAMYGAGYFLWPLIEASKAPLDEDGFNAAYDAFAARVLDSGVPQALLPTDLWVPTSLRTAAQRVVKAINLEGGRSNTNRDVVTLHVVPYLDNA